MADKTANWKPLHMAKSIKELNSISAGSTKLDEKVMNPRMLSRSSEKLYLKAYDMFMEGDQEQAYIFLLRYLDVIQVIRNSKEYKQNKKQLDSLIDKSKFKKALEDAEKLSKELSERFEMLCDNHMDSAVLPITEGKEETFHPNGNGLITCEKLYYMLTSRPDDVLVVDCRKRSHIMSSTVSSKKCSQWLPIPQEVILSNKGNLTAFMSPSQEKLWKERISNGRKYIVLVDSYCNLSPQSTINVMKSALNKEDIPLVLDGGYNRWYLSYSPLCSGKWSQKESANEEKVTDLDIESFSYPSSAQLIPPKPQILPPEAPLIEQINNKDIGTNDILVPSNPTQLRTPPSNVVAANYTTHPSELPQTAMHLLPPVPSVPLPLELEGRDVHALLDTELLPPTILIDQQPAHPLYYLDSRWYLNADNPQSYQGNVVQFNEHEQLYQPSVSSMHPHIPPQEQHQQYQYYTNNPVVTGDSHHFNQPFHNTALVNVDSSQPLHPTDTNNQPTSQPGYGVEAHTNQNIANTAINEDPNKSEDPTVLSFEKELRDHHKDMLKESEDQRRVAEEQIKNLFEEEHRKLEQKREEMQLELKKQKEKNESELQEMKLKTQQDMEQRLAARMKELGDMYERERSNMMKNNEQMKHYWEMMRQQENSKHQFVSNQGLPPGWEKRLDSTTGRFYYVDHSSRTTHWNPPTSLLQYQAEIQKQQQQQIKPTLPHPNQPPLPLPSKVTLPKNPAQKNPRQPKDRFVSDGSQVSTATSNDDKVPPVTQSPSLPVVDRSNKPINANPSNVRQMSVEVYRGKMANLHPVIGSSCPGLTGLVNLGNTCFMNSVIQCVFATPPLMKFFVSNKYRAELNLNNPLGSGGELAEEFFILCRATWVERFKQITPREFKSMISRVAPYFSGNQQHDSQEFLMYFLDGLHEDLNRVKVKTYIEIPDSSDIADHVAAKQAWDIHKKRNNSIIIDLFYGILKSIIQCLICKKRKVMFEPFLSLSLPIPDGRSSCSYTDCLNLFGAAEKLSGDNKWFCPQCKQQRDAVKKLSIWRLPPVLLLHFKRFKDGKGTIREKKNTHISFPTENLLVDELVVGPKFKSKYNLFAIVNHTGNLGSGHYTACCKNAHNGLFYLFNDENVRQANSRDLSSSSAYLLCYTCQDFESLKL